MLQGAGPGDATGLTGANREEQAVSRTALRETLLVAWFADRRSRLGVASINRRVPAPVSASLPQADTFGSLP